MKTTPSPSTYTEINLAAIASNLKVVRRALAPKTKVLAVVKANAYGHGLAKVAAHLAQTGVDYFGVFRLEEAVELRQAEIRQPILLMGGTSGFEMAVHLQVIIGITDFAMLEQLSTYATKQKILTPVRVHIKVDTGMQRLGIEFAEYLQHIEIIKKYKNIAIEGIYSHLANADNLQDDFSDLQLQRFQQVCQATQKVLSGRVLLRHLANSDGIFRNQAVHLDMVRPGIALYGYCKRAPVALQPAMQLKSTILQLKSVQPGETVGYDRLWKAERPSRVAIVPIGYADGFSRSYSGASVIVAASEQARQTSSKQVGVAKIIGRICMDMLMVDVTELPWVELGDEMILLGQKGELQVDAYDLARLSGTTHYQVLTSIQSRVPRIWTNAGIST
jgi:alanine racemase